MDTIRRLFELLTPSERKRLYILFVAVLIMAGLEVVSVASIFPFLSVASDPGTIQENVYLSWAYEQFGFSSDQTFLIALGLLALTALVASNVFIVFVMWLQHRYVWNRNHSISKRLLTEYLQRPYEYFLDRNSADLSKNILEEAGEVTTQMLRPAIQGLAKGIVAVAIVLFLVIFDPYVAALVTVVLGGAYSIIYFVVRGKLNDLGEKRVEANRGRFESVNEAFGGIKEVKLRGNEETFVKEFEEPSKWYAHYQALSKVLHKAPRYVLEAVAFGGVILIAVVLIAAEQDMNQVLPVLGLYAFAGYRLMPALQRAFKGVALAHFNKASLDTLHRDIFEPSEHGFVTSRDDDARELDLTNSLRLDDVTFTYPGADQPAIRGMDLEIPAQTTVGFVGQTGSGKTTTMDILLGLLRPQEGTVRIDGTPLDEHNLRAWQKTVGYVPQHIYLSDDTIARNIAFGAPESEIDYDAIEEAIRRAQIYDFVAHDLSDGLQTMVGERGVKLSGGQRQRIGIARALYRRPSVVFFDEATSALDQDTENEVMEAVYALGETRTVIMISHRLSTVERADRIFRLNGGRLVDSGTYQEVVRGKPSGVVS